MSHYEQRLENDLTRIRSSVSDMAAKVEIAVKNALHALHTGNDKLAAATILADHPINRAMRRIDHSVLMTASWPKIMVLRSSVAI